LRRDFGRGFRQKKLLPILSIPQIFGKIEVNGVCDFVHGHDDQAGLKGRRFVADLY
jgi:hypothetical protein